MTSVLFCSLNKQSIKSHNGHSLEKQAKQPAFVLAKTPSWGEVGTEVGVLSQRESLDFSLGKTKTHTGHS